MKIHVFEGGADSQKDICCICGWGKYEHRLESLAWVESPKIVSKRYEALGGTATCRICNKSSTATTLVIPKRGLWLCDECCASIGKPGAVTGDKDFDATLTQCFEILGVKGKDYTVGSPDRLANFNRAAELLGMRPEQVLAVYWYKHVAAVLNYIKTGGQSESEPIEGRITDNINYMLLFSKMVAEKKRTTAPPVPKGFQSALMSSACVKCGKVDCTVNDESWCFDCFSNIGTAPACVQWPPVTKTIHVAMAGYPVEAPK